MSNVFAVPNDIVKPPTQLKRIKRKPPPVYDPSEFLLDPELSSPPTSPLSTTGQLQVAGLLQLPDQFSSPSCSHGFKQAKFGRPPAKPAEAHCRPRPQTAPVRPSTEPPHLRNSFQPFQLAGVGDLATSHPANLAFFARTPFRTESDIPAVNQYLIQTGFTSVSDSCVPCTVKQKGPTVLIPGTSFLNQRHRRRNSSLLSSISSPPPVTPESSSELLSLENLSGSEIISLHEHCDSAVPEQRIQLLDSPSSLPLDTTKNFARPRKLKRRVRLPEAPLETSSESSSVGSFDAYALPSAEQLEKAARLNVISKKGEKIRFGDLWKNQKTVVLFIRHFLCPQCQDYMFSIARSLSPALLCNARVKLVIISNGAFEMIHSYGKIFRTPFTIYTDPEHQVYNAMGMTLHSLEPGPPGSYIRHGMLSGIGMVVMNAVKVGMPIWKNGGKISQLGGEFVLGPGINCSFAHRMRYTRDHLPILDVVAQTGFAVSTRLCEMNVSDQTYHPHADSEEEWVEERSKILEELRRRKALRRGGFHWVCSDDDGDLPEEPLQCKELFIAVSEDTSVSQVDNKHRETIDDPETDSSRST